MYRIYQFDKSMDLVDSVKRKECLKIYGSVYLVDPRIEIV